MSAVDDVLARLHDHVVPHQVAALRGIVRFDLNRDGRGDVMSQRHVLEFAGGSMTLHRDQPADAPADVVLTTDEPCFVGLVSGERNAGLEYLAGRLDIDGDAALAIGIGGIFRVRGTGGVAVDPTLLDPVEVAAAVGKVPRRHLQKVMASGFRPIVLGEIFRRLPDFVNAQRARGVSLAVGFRLLGNPSGEVERYVVHLRDGVARVETGRPAHQPDATITCQGHDYLRLATGHLNPVLGVLKGALQVRGDRAKALQLSTILDIPRAP